MSNTDNESSSTGSAGGQETYKTRAERQAAENETPNRWVPRAEFRLWMYRVLAAAGPIVTFYGVASSEEVALWLGLGGTVLGTPAASLAAVNVPGRAARE